MSTLLDIDPLCTLGTAQNCVGFVVSLHGDQFEEVDGQIHNKFVLLCCTRFQVPVTYKTMLMFLFYPAEHCNILYKTQTLNQKGEPPELFVCDTPTTK